MLRPILTGVTLLALTGVVVAQSDVISTRRNVMKGVGAATRTGGQMAKGEIPFDLAKAQEILKTYGHAAEVSHTYYPENAKTGGETTAAPKIWESPEEFKARFVAWGKQIETASGEVKDLPTFRASFTELTKACGGCHNTFRIKTS